MDNENRSALTENEESSLPEAKKTSKYALKKEEIFLIPNLITYFRMICIPIFVVLCLMSKNNPPLIYWSLGVFAVAAVSDLIDGKIARKFNMVSNIGKVFDPLADKLMHICVLICLTVIGYAPWYFIAFICLKELVMVSLSPVFVKKNIIIPAVMAGKVASAEISFAVVAAFFHALFVEHGIYVGNATFTPDWFLLLVGCILAGYAAGTYIYIAHNKLKEFNRRFSAGEIDKYGREIAADVANDTEAE